MEHQLLNIEEFNRLNDNAFMRIETWKTEYGIIQKMFMAGHIIQETPSPRPYQLGQACDGTIDTCVIALFILYCREVGLEPQKILQTAYPIDDWNYFTYKYQQKKIIDAQTEGIEIPESWKNLQALDGLCESLHEINLHQLANILEELQQ